MNSKCSLTNQKREQTLCHKNDQSDHENRLAPISVSSFDLILLIDFLNRQSCIVFTFLFYLFF